MDKADLKKTTTGLLAAIMAVEDLLDNAAELQLVIIDSDAACEAIAGTNATGYGIDEIAILGIRIDLTKLVIQIEWAAGGDQDPDKMFSGNHIAGRAEVILNDGEPTVTNVTADVDRGQEECRQK